MKGIAYWLAQECLVAQGKLKPGEPIMSKKHYDDGADVGNAAAPFYGMSLDEALAIVETFDNMENLPPSNVEVRAYARRVVESYARRSMELYAAQFKRNDKVFVGRP